MNRLPGDCNPFAISSFDRVSKDSAPAPSTRQKIAFAKGISSTRLNLGIAVMPSNRLGILGLLVTLPALAQVTSGPTAPVATTPISPRQHAPMRFHKLRSDGTLESENWSGYAVTGSSFTHVRGTWIVPTVFCGVTPNTYSSFWVGLDGLSSGTVEQIGTDSDCDGVSPSYYAWYEFNPSPAMFIGSLSIEPGNQMSATVSYSDEEFTLTITNETTGESFSKSSPVSGAKRSSAEWIAEAPCCTMSGGILPLADFEIVSFGADHATDASTAGPISAFRSNVQKMTMASSKGVDEAAPSPLMSDGTSFKVTWKSE
jgi:hypothetical protein